MPNRLHHLLPLLNLTTRPTSQTADDTYDLDELLDEAEALLHVPALLRPTHLEAVVAV